MKLINNKGRVLLQVTGAEPSAGFGTLYSYTGDRCGGFTSIAGLRAAIHAIQLDAPSARIVGTLPDARGQA